MQKIKSFWRLAYHNKSTRRIYANDGQCGDYSLGQEFQPRQIYSKQDILDMIEMGHFDSITLPFIILIPVGNKESKKSTSSSRHSGRPSESSR